MRLFLSFLLIFSGLHSATLCAQIEITDSHGKYRFNKPPERTVVLNWALAEQLVELGVTPVGMADIEGFQKHANKPEVNISITDVGKRLTPNLAKIRELNPDVILIGYSQRPLIKSLSNIATVIYFKNFGKRYNNYEKSRERFLEIAKLFDKTQYAETRLSKLDSDLNALKLSLEHHYQRKQKTEAKPYPLVLFSVSNNDSKNSTWIFGRNSMPYYAARELGLNVFDTDEDTDKFGVTRLSSKQLNNTLAQKNQHLSSDTGFDSKHSVVCNLKFSSFATHKPIETGFPSHNNSSCGTDLAFQNPFGGTMSVLYLAQALHDALIGELDL